MFSLNKRFIAGLLIFAMIFANAGMSTLAVSISHYVDRANQNAKDDSDISYRYYEEYRYSYESRMTLLMNNGSDDTAAQDKAGDSAENPAANENETGISEETDSSDFDVENNESENKNDEEPEEDGVGASTASPEDDDESEESEEGSASVRPYDEEPEDDGVGESEDNVGESEDIM